MQLIRPRQEGETQHGALADQGDGSSKTAEAVSPPELLESLEQLNVQFKEFEKIREQIKTRIASLVQLVPGLNDRKQLLQHGIDEKRKQIQHLDRQFPGLNRQKEALLQSIPQKKGQKALLEKEIRQEQDKVKALKSLITKLTREKNKMEKTLQRKQDQMSKIDAQIQQIQSVQASGVDLVSTLVYASKKR